MVFLLSYGSACHPTPRQHLGDAGTPQELGREQRWHERLPRRMHEGRLQELGKGGTAKYLHGAAAGKDTTRMWGEGCCKLVSEDPPPPPAVTSARSHPSDGGS